MLNLLAYRMANGKIANYDEQTSIHYGVISQNSVISEIWESFESVYEIECANCGHVYSDNESANCPKCDIDNHLEFECADSPSYWKWNGEKEYALEYAESLSAFYVTRSPYYTYAAFCSPCAPNAGDLDAPRKKGIKTYCLDASFFESNNAPYPVYRVSDNQRVEITPK